MAPSALPFDAHLKVDLPPVLRSFFAATNAIENLMGVIRVAEIGARRVVAQEVVARRGCDGIVIGCGSFRRHECGYLTSLR